MPIRMNIQFNPDGSIKLPTQLAARAADQERQMALGRCFHVRKEVVSKAVGMKKCVLHVTVSEKMAAEMPVERIYKWFLEANPETPTKIVKVDANRYAIEIGTAFRRCTDCTSFVSRLKGFTDGNIIIEKGMCSFEQNNRSFAYEDFFE
jgi:hypothetical protein